MKAPLAAPPTHAGEALRADPRLGPQFQRGTLTGAVYNLSPQVLSYDADYFLSEYEAQYGKTYLADEPQLRQLARNRLKLLEDARPGARGVLFELGSAAGFFLDEAARAGYAAQGLEISDYAARHAREKLALDVRTASFDDWLPAPESYDVIAAFYVIEHLPDQPRVFDTIARALKPGGRFVFALPSANGPLMEFDPARWMQSHPADHCIDYDPQSLKRTLPLYGMQFVAARPASYRPERAQGWKGARWFRPFYKTYARRFAYGDTVEGVAIKPTRAEPR
jgi:SAM-dependent methyltransferase